MNKRVIEMHGLWAGYNHEMVLQDIDFTAYGKVRVKDSTCFQLPDNMEWKYKGSGGASSKASVRLQFEYNLKNGAILDLSIHPFNVQDMANANESISSIDTGDPVIRDLGYVKSITLKKYKNSNRLTT
jgi:hypothetical protein